MFIVQARTSTAKDGSPYVTHRLVESRREGVKVRQKTLLNLGRNFSVDQRDWRLLCQRVNELINGQATLNFLTLPMEIETEARRIVKRLLERRGHTPEISDWETVDIHSAQDIDSRSIGVEHAALEALKILDIPNKLCSLGLNQRQQGCALAMIISRMAQPGSVRAANYWLRTASAAGELLEIDFGSLNDEALNRASNHLIKHKTALEDHISRTVDGHVNQPPIVTLYDLTDQHFREEEEGPNKPSTAQGHILQQCSNAYPISLGAVLDNNGFLRYTKIVPGNVIETCTLETMLTSLNVPKGSIIAMDHGLSTEENRAWMRSKGYIYLVVSHNSNRTFRPHTETAAISTISDGELTVYLEQIEREDTEKIPYKEVLLRYHANARQTKETDIITRCQARFEEGLRQLNASLSKPRTQKTLAKIQHKIEHLQKENARIAPHYNVTITSDQESKKVVALTWKLNPPEDSMMHKPDVCRLQSNERNWDANTMWKTYVMLKDVESVFRSLKPALGLRPIHHRTEQRADGHLLFLAIAYHAIQILRKRMAQTNTPANWTTIRNVLNSLQRTTTTFARPDGRTLHLRKTALPDADQAAIYKGMQIGLPPQDIRKTIV